MTTWFITGGSSGLGKALTEAVLKTGDNVVVTARSTDRIAAFAEAHPQAALPVAMDLTDDASIAAAVEAARAKFGGIDILVNNAGYGYRAAIEEGEPEAIEALFRTHVFGPLALMKAVLPEMRARRAGTIVNYSSIAAQQVGPGSGYYSAVKRATEGLTLALKLETAPLGIRAMVVEPGAFRTDFSGRSLVGTATEIADYAPTVGPRRKANDRTDGTQPGDPARAAEVLIEVLARPTLPQRLLLGSDAVRIVRGALEAQLAEIEEMQEFTLRTDLDPA